MGKWEIIKLNELSLRMHQGINTVADKVEYQISGIPIIQSKNITQGNLDLEDVRYVNYENYEKYRSKYNPCIGDVLVSNIGTIGKSLVISKENSFLIAWNVFLISLKKEKMFPKYFNYFMNYLYLTNYYEKLLTGGTVKFINKKKMGDIEIPLPPIDVQKKIAQILDVASELIALRKKQLAELDNLIKSTFYDMFGDPVVNEKGWEVNRLGEKCNIITGNTPPRADKDNYGTFIEWIKSDNINTNAIYLTFAEEYLSEKGFKLCRYVDEPSVLMTCIAGSIKCIGNVAIANRKVSFNQQINAIVPKKNNVYYIYTLFLLTQQYIQSTINMSLKGILSKGKLTELKFIFPPIDLQNKFAQIVTKIEEQKALVQKALDESQYLFDSLMSEYFE